MRVLLGPEDILDILALQERVIEVFGPDRIWVHDAASLYELFGRGEDFLALGVRSGSRLIAVSLSRLMNPFEVRPLTPTLPWSDEPAHIGLNTLSLPGAGVGSQMIGLLRERREHLRGRGVHHLFGGISPDHVTSLGCAFRAGAVGVGHLRVPDATEILLWHGPGLAARNRGVQRCRVATKDLEAQVSLMRRGFALCGHDPEDRGFFTYSLLNDLMEAT